MPDREPVALVLGPTGQVGVELTRALGPVARVVACPRSRCDLANAAGIAELIRDARPDVVVNAAAYTAVEQAEVEPELAMRLNGDAPGVIASAARGAGALFVHYSTDYVFDGTRIGAYDEDDPTNPINVYGASKLAGEMSVRASGCDHLIFRTSWVYASHGQNFVRTMLRLGRERPRLTVVADQIGAPTCARSIADATARVIAQILGAGPASPGRRELSGTYHMTAAGTTSWFEFARAIFDGAFEKAERPEVVPVASTDYPTRARRPLNSTLNGAKLESTFGVRLPRWQDDLAIVLADLAARPA